jgi:hypothetical protein
VRCPPLLTRVLLQSSLHLSLSRSLALAAHVALCSCSSDLLPTFLEPSFEASSRGKLQ